MLSEGGGVGGGGGTGEGQIYHVFAINFYIVGEKSPTYLKVHNSFKS